MISAKAYFLLVTAFVQAILINRKSNTPWVIPQQAGMVQESHSNCSFLLRKSNELSGFSGTSEKDKSIKTKNNFACKK